MAGAPVSASLDLSSGIQTAVLTDPAYRGWQLNGFSATSQFGVTVAFTSSQSSSDRGRVIADYRPWRLVEICDIAGLCVLIVMICVFMGALIRSRYKHV